MKRLTDLVMGVMFTVLLAVSMLLIVIAVCLTSKGQVALVGSGWAGQCAFQVAQVSFYAERYACRTDSSNDQF